MLGTNCDNPFASVELLSAQALPPDAVAMLDNADSLFAGRAWWDVVLAHAMPAGAAASFVAIGWAGRIAALLPMMRIQGRLTSLSTPYTCEYVPQLAGGLLFGVGFDTATPQLVADFAR